MDESFHSPELSKQFELVGADCAHGSGALQNTPVLHEDVELNVETLSTVRTDAKESIRPENEAELTISQHLDLIVLLAPDNVLLPSSFLKNFFLL